MWVSTTVVTCAAIKVSPSREIMPVIGGIASMVVTTSAAVLFPQLRRVDALTAKSLQEAERELSVAEPVN